MSVTYIAVVVLAFYLPFVLFDIVFRPAIRRIGLRNVARRPGEAALVVVGSMLATALIVASFIVGDSFGTSFRVRAEEFLGPIDMLVLSEDIDADMANLTASLDGDGATIESLLSVREGDINTANDQGKVEPRVTFWEVDPIEVKAFGNDLDASGLEALPDSLGPKEAAINTELADELNIQEGDTIDVVAGEASVTFDVAVVLPRKGVAGFAPMLLAPGALSGEFGNVDGFRDSIVISNIGGTYEGAESIDESEDYIRSVLGEDVTVTKVKQFTLERADRIGSNTTTQFSTVGGFSVAAGVLLLINLFVMLASERKVDLGTMRAIGVQRGHTRRAFSIEGLVYGVIASAVGLLVGIGVASAVIRYAGGAFGVEDGFEIRLAVTATSLFSGAVIGLAISQITVWFTTAKVVRLNIVAALKDAVVPRSSGESNRQIILGLLAVVGAAVAWVLASDSQAVAFVAPIVGAVGLIPAATRLVGQKIAMLLGCGAGLFWAAFAFGILADTFDDTDIRIFLLQGIAMVGLAVAILASFDRWLVAAIQVGTRSSVSSRLGLSNPLARPVRTALLVSMYALVIFTVTFMAILNTVLAQQGPEYTKQAGGSYDLYALSSAVSPLETDQLVSRDDIAAAVEVESGFALIASSILDFDDDPETAVRSQPDDEVDPERRRVTLISPEFVSNGAPTLVERGSQYASDTTAWEAVADNADLAIAPLYFGIEVGETVQILDGNGERSEVTIVGLSDWNWMSFFGMYVSEGQSGSLLAETQPGRRHHIVAAEGVDPAELQETLEADFARNGTDVGSFAEDIRAEASETEAFIQILQGFLGLGLLIGIAGLSVVLIRSVRERRQQLGMLRAIGFGPGLLRNSFLIEAFFIGIQGVALGVGLGILSSWQVLTKSTAFADDLEFAVPVPWLAGLALVALAASMMAGLFPALQAGRTEPAVALRLPS